MAERKRTSKVDTWIKKVGKLGFNNGVKLKVILVGGVSYEYESTAF